MRLVLDACVLYPTVMREMLLGAAEAGFFTPLWSDRLLEEWARAAERRSVVDGLQARGEIALLRGAWPKALVPAQSGLEARLWLPDDGDVHVLATAVASSAAGIVTVNAKDFPKGVLAEEGLIRIDPDALLYGFWLEDAPRMEALGVRISSAAEAIDGTPKDIRSLLKKARLPKLAKALALT